ncbi:exonuclease domain-containing protein [Chitinasiproducens palmae]|uniref:DNA-directed DNA polymerase n=1 Tax=Chitinasiproducens palmae TaxID=1770053 RepID=A0A1H2PRX8_9BURK|nr:exonuclease domain-containing protein [Chitinasiproducens palmae]SDV49648.1 DNA polymerase-3 subunit epsilon [Chitinasiproducens palmae]
MAFVDLETTGGTARTDRIIEVAIVVVDDDGEHVWQSLVNPGQRIPQAITALTGIDDAMVADAPTFADLAGEIASRLQGHIFVAHNARFDFGFLKNEFGRLGADFRATVLCTVRLSRRLFPHYARHGLDALIERHRLQVSDRHRALGDAQAIAQFWRLLPRHVDPPVLREAFDALTAVSSLPASLDADLPARLPTGPGVYLFFGENDLPIYIGKAVNLRQRVLNHFSSDHSSQKEMRLSQEVRRVEWRECAGELGALLEEARLVKAMAPVHNRLLRRQEKSFAWRLDDDLFGGRLTLVDLSEPMRAELGPGGPIYYGPYQTRRDAQAAARTLADRDGLCLAHLGLEKVSPGRPCFSHQVRRCRGACVGLESAAAHHARVDETFATHRLKPWPFAGAAVIEEGAGLHVIHHWDFLGSAGTLDECLALLEGRAVRFDRDVYRLLNAAGGAWLAKARPLVGDGAALAVNSAAPPAGRAASGVGSDAVSDVASGVDCGVDHGVDTNAGKIAAIPVRATAAVAPAAAVTGGTRLADSVAGRHETSAFADTEMPAA